jgi:hypothetical protein
LHHNSGGIGGELREQSFPGRERGRFKRKFPDARDGRGRIPERNHRDHAAPKPIAALLSRAVKNEK